MICLGRPIGSGSTTNRRNCYEGLVFECVSSFVF